MSEKLYALLLRLYPACFRAVYGEEALQVFRDRLRDEVGFFAKLRLWIDLFLDLAISVPREHRARRPALSPSRAHTGLFRILEDQPPRPGAFLLGSALALSGVIAFFVLLDHAGVRHAPRAEQDQQAATSVPRDPAGAPNAASAQGAGVVASASPASAQLQAHEQANVTAPLHLSVITPPMDPAERHRVIAAVADSVRRYYFDKHLAETTATTLLAEEKSGVDRTIASRSALAATLTRQLYGTTHDMHLAVIYSAEPLPTVPAGATLDAMARYRQILLDQHCLIEHAELLPYAVGYLKFNGFPDPAICGPQFQSAMDSLNSSRALIIDLRDNRGGQPAMVALLAGYFFEHPQPWYNPREPGSSTLAAPIGNTRFVHTPVYILTSKLTFSAAEHFSYNLQMLHRATIVGEITGGAAHAGAFHRIDDHFGIAIPEFRIVNPYSDRDWQSVGVHPDVPVGAADALATAQQLAERHLSASQ